MFYRILPFLGLAVMIALCLAFSKNRKLALQRWPLLAWGLGLQFIFALIILKTPAGRWFFLVLNDVFLALIACTKDGAAFVFGDKLTDPMAGLGYFAFFVLSVIIFFSALSAILYHTRILPVVVKGIAWVMAKTMKTSGAETLSAAANIFVGQTEAPLVVRPFIPTMTRSELMAIMTGGFATIAGSVMAAYIFFLQDAVPGIAGHLMSASVMSAPAALLFAKLLVPEEGKPDTYGTVDIKLPKVYDNVLDAAAGGASEGIRLALNVGGMIIAFLALLALANLVLGLIPMGLEAIGVQMTEETKQLFFTLQGLVGLLFAPMAWLMGIPWEEALPAGELLGLKMITNEFIAYPKLGEMSEVMSERTRVIMTYALCGFANIGSIGIQIGGLSILAPERRVDLANLAFPALIAGTFACNSTACVAAVLTPMG